MPQLPEPWPDFAGLFAEPSIGRLLSELTSHQFEHFVMYVFEQAGYSVEDTAGRFGEGLDVKLYTGPAHARVLHAGVSVKHFTPPATVVNGQHMMNFHGALRGMPGYAVTTSTFNPPALAEVQKEPRIWPIDGDHFLRYINYVRGSRAVEAEDTEPDARLRTNAVAPIPPEVLLAADDITRRPQQQTTVLTLANHKGGVGKTTSVLNLAFGLMALDQQVLLVDMDAQANLTKELPAQAPGVTPLHIGDYFRRKRALPDLIRQTQFKRLWLIPSDNTLTRSDAGIAAGPGAELRFARDLHAAEVAPPPVLDARPFDWIILDTGPSMGLFTRSALAASHFVLMPIAPSVFADMGTDLLTQTVATMRALVGKPIALLGSLVTQWKDDALNRQLLETATARLEPAGLPLLSTKIPLDKNNIEKAHLETGQGRRRNLLDRRCAAARAYVDVVSEVVAHVEPRPDNGTGAIRVHA